MKPSAGASPSPSRPVVSVVIAVLNGASTLGRCLSSIHAQEWPHEIVVIDGGSTDGTVDILHTHAERLAYWHSRPDGGIADAWNQALTVVRGSWVLFLGADDFLAEPHSLERLASVDDGRLDVIAGRIALVTPAGHVRQIAGGRWSWQRMQRGMAIAHSGSLQHRSLLERFGPFDPAFPIAADYDLLLRAGPEMRASFVDEVVVAQGDGGVSQRRIPSVFAEWYRIQARHPAVGPWRAVWHRIGHLARYVIGYRLLPFLTFGFFVRPRRPTAERLVAPTPGRAPG